MAPSRCWRSTNGSIMPFSVAMRRIQWSGMMGMAETALGCGARKALPGLPFRCPV
jgi:hypothetical protein